jgi:hypothetical protein
MPPVDARIVTRGPDTGDFGIPSYFTIQRIVPWLKNATMLFFKPKMELGLRQEEKVL